MYPIVPNVPSLDKTQSSLSTHIEDSVSRPIDEVTRVERLNYLQSRHSSCWATSVFDSASSSHTDFADFATGHRRRYRLHCRGPPWNLSSSDVFYFQSTFYRTCCLNLPSSVDGPLSVMSPLHSSWHPTDDTVWRVETSLECFHPPLRRCLRRTFHHLSRCSSYLCVCLHCLHNAISLPQDCRLVYNTSIVKRYLPHVT